jgi:hypothetical protein
MLPCLLESFRPAVGQRDRNRYCYIIAVEEEEDEEEGEGRKDRQSIEATR